MPARSPERLTLAQARRVALAAQGFAVERPAAVGNRALTATLARLGVVQIDSVNVLSRAHYLPFFSRLGAYDRGGLDALAGRAPRRLVEYWAHEASYVPPATLPLLHWRMQRWETDAWGSLRRVAVEHPDLVAAVLEEVGARGPVTAVGLERALAHDLPRAKDHWGWNWSLVKQALEHLFFSGRVTSAGRTAQFERRYALPERALPAAALAAPPEDPFPELVETAARATGVATERDLRDYFRLPVADARHGIEVLVERGVLLPVQVGELRRPAYLHAAARLPRRVEARALLAPFDPLVWQRDRVEELFGFRYRIEIYVPAPQRVHGYYVLPFLLGDRLVARVDLKADRAAGVLVVQGAYAEPDAPPATARELAEELGLLAGWLGLDQVRVVPRGDLAAALAGVVGA
ncbi:hypothetical protein EV189_1917 [Motilibacter rhizosphaerae]|uniref:Winged helix-turn-helix protein n=1 Tax=Motilibacter rhizosphaerae TaxID=598652 RepID=A0A4Q7NT18_9ACTN|nr:crosslink repair DNA glycosylase YcaQ family protein [Motilibacter rhizosphaerae]RZS90134.1 hypothetical protein EV189_1917 [Motilibacter rhizosphaerae]